MDEKPVYTKREMAIVYASLVSFSTISTMPMLLGVFMTDPVNFKCHTGNGTQLNGTCPGNRVDECSYIEYDKSLWTNNLVMELDLVCDRAWMKALPNYGWFTGMLFTVILLQLSDVCGRWTVIFGCQMGLTVTVFLSAMSSTNYLYRYVTD